MTLKNVYIGVRSDIKNFNNNYITNNSRLVIDIVKKFNSSEFKTDIDLTNANIDLSPFEITKKKGLASKAGVTLNFDKNNYLQLKDFIWTAENSKMSGNLLMQISPFKIDSLDLHDSNFGNNNFILSYLVDDDLSARILKISGTRMDLGVLIKNPIISDSKNDKVHYQNNIVQVDLDHLYLANGIRFRNININLNCSGATCDKGFVLADMRDGKIIDINISTKSSDDYSMIDGRISDISLLAEALNISNKIVSGDTKINAKLESIDDKNIITGKLKIDSGFSILKNDVVDEISNQNAFVKSKHKIISNNKTKFNSLKVEFQMVDDDLTIQTLIASSYFLGVTSKGKINLSDGSISLKGLIVPGYSLNRLFGLGNVPIIGAIISPLLIGEKGGGIFAIRYEYNKLKDQKEGKFKINPISALIPGGVRNILDLF